VGIGVLLPLTYAFFPAVYSTAVIPTSIFVRLGLVAMFVTKKQLWENQEFIDPACEMKITTLFQLLSNAIIKPSCFRWQIYRFWSKSTQFQSQTELSTHPQPSIVLNTKHTHHAE